MFCILIKSKDKTEYELFTNEIFNTEKETLDYVKRSKFNKKTEWKVVEYDMKYFRNEIDKEKNMLTKEKIDKALDAFYWGDISNKETDEYGSGYKLLYKDEDTINLIGEVLHMLESKNDNLKADLALAKEEIHTFCLECSCRKYLKEDK